MSLLSQGGRQHLQFTQSVAASTWNIAHNFGQYPAVDVSIMYNGTMQKAFPLSITHTDENNVVITWSSARTGTAVLTG